MVYWTQPCTENAHNSIKEFLDAKDIPMRNVSFKWLEKYEVWYLARDNKINGLAVNLRTLRALLNKAIKSEDLDSKYYPFKTYKIKKAKTRKRAVSESDIQKIKDFEPERPYVKKEQKTIS